MENRDYKNYGGQTTTYLDPLLSKFVKLFVIAARFTLTDKSLALSFEGWESTDSFDERASPLLTCRREFNKSGAVFQATQTEYKEVFDLLEIKVLQFLEVPESDYKLESFSIDVDKKRITLAARHNSKADRRISETINSETDFDAALAEHPELVGAYFNFAWTFGKENDDFLASLRQDD